MGFSDKLKGIVGQARTKASDAVDKHGDKISGGIDKAAKFADDKTKGKYSDKIDKGTAKAKETLEKIDKKDDGDLKVSTVDPARPASAPSGADAGRFAVIPAAYVVCLRPSAAPGGTAEVLLQLRSGTGFMDEHWACGAAGHVERGESALAAAQREAGEELGIEVDLSFFTTLQRRHGAEPVAAIDERIDFFFVATSWRGVPTIQEDAKCAALDWFPLDALPTPLVPHEALVLDEVRRVVGPAGTLVAQPAPFLTDGF